MTALKYWDTTTNQWLSMTLTQQNNVKISTSAPTDTSQLWVDPNDVTYQNLVDGGSA
jgi:hypothetical protein